MKNLRDPASHGLKALKVWLKDMKRCWPIKSKGKYTQNQWLGGRTFKFEVGLFFKGVGTINQSLGQIVSETSGFSIMVFSESYTFIETWY